MEQAHYHLLDLLLGCFTVPDNRLLYLQGRVFINRQASMHQCTDRRTACLSKQQGGLRIDVNENFFYDRLCWLVGTDDFADPGKKRRQPFWQGLLVIGLDAATGDVVQLVALHFDDAKASDAQARVDAEDARQVHLVRPTR